MDKELYGKYMDMLKDNPDNYAKEIAQFLSNNKDRLLQKLTKTRVDVMQTSAKWLTHETMSIPTKFVTKQMGFETMATDGKSVFINPVFWDSLDRQQRLFGLCHEVLHVLFMHCNKGRIGKRQAMLWNIAVDVWVNSTLMVCGIGKHIEGGIESSNYGRVELDINGSKIVFDNAHMLSAEEIYSRLQQHVQTNPPQKGDGQPEDKVKDGNGNDVQPFDSHELNELSNEEVSDAIGRLRRKQVENKLRGNLPGFISEKLDAMLEGKVNWRNELRDLITPMIAGRESWHRMSRRSYAVGTSLPVRKKEGLEVTVVADTSGSIGKKELMYYFGEVRNIFNQFEPGSVKVKLMLHHTDVYQVVDLMDAENLSEIKIESGGTSHLDVFEKLEEDDTKVAIFLTDGYSDFPGSNPGIDRLLWLVTDKNGVEKIPSNLGKVIPIDLDDLGGD
jgi:predicted metal-dependent peptidase